MNPENSTPNVKSAQNRKPQIAPTSVIDEHEVAVLGGGPVGVCAAIAASRSLGISYHQFRYYHQKYQT